SGKLEFVQIGGRKFIRNGAWEKFLDANTKGAMQWPDETTVQDSVTSKIAEFSTSPGQSMAAAASAALARQTANSLRSSSPTGSSGKASASAQVIHLKCS